jgi:hypothetical protein
MSTLILIIAYCFFIIIYLAELAKSRLMFHTAKYPAWIAFVMVFMECAFAPLTVYRLLIKNIIETWHTSDQPIIESGSTERLVRVTLTFKESGYNRVRRNFEKIGIKKISEGTDLAYNLLLHALKAREQGSKICFLRSDGVLQEVDLDEAIERLRLSSSELDKILKNLNVKTGGSVDE